MKNDFIIENKASSEALHTLENGSQRDASRHQGGQN